MVDNYKKNIYVILIELLSDLLSDLLLHELDNEKEMNFYE